MRILKSNFSRTAFFVFFTYFIALLFNNPNYSTAKQNDYWPTKGWKTSTPEAQGMDSNLLANMLENIKKVNIKVHGQDKYGIHSITIVRNGKMVLDVYFHDFTSEDLHIIHSCTKSIMSILIGIAIDQGHIKDIHRPINSYFPEKQFANMDERKNGITLEHLLMMAHGLECRDSYRYGWKGIKEMRSRNDWIQYMLDLPMAETPGIRFEYCNGASFLLSAILQKTAGIKTIEFARSHLFTPLGIRDIKWETNLQGITIGWGRLYLRPRAMAKIGYLSLKQGQWENRQIVSKDWMKTSTRKHINTNHPAAFRKGYGYQWWVNPPEQITALGHRGQYILIVPQKNLVVVFTSDLKGPDFYAPYNLFRKYILPSVKSDTTLPPNPEGYQSLNTIINKQATSR